MPVAPLGWRPIPVWCASKPVVAEPPQLDHEYVVRQNGLPAARSYCAAGHATPGLREETFLIVQASGRQSTASCHPNPGNMPRNNQGGTEAVILAHPRSSRPRPAPHSTPGPLCLVSFADRAIICPFPAMCSSLLKGLPIKKSGRGPGSDCHPAQE